MQVVVAKRVVLNIFLAGALVAILVPTALAGDDGPTIEEQMAGLQAMCIESADARADRQNEKPLYERLGGYDRILELTTEVVRLHSINPQIKHFVEGVDHERLAKLVADFIAAGTGGTVTYTGRSLPDSHAHLDLTDADFLAAGGDIIKGMQSLKYGQEEIDELVCIFVSLKDQVIFK